VNLYPRSAEEIRQLIHARLPFVPVSIIRPSILPRLGWLLRSPGTAYSFLGIREA
jgi:hypothetical protein